MSNAKYWTAVVWLESARPDWEECAGDLLQIPFCYAIHDFCKDEVGEERKLHAHFILAFPNTTTYNHALETINALSVEGKKCANKVEKVVMLRHMYEYLIHNTEDCKKKGKHLYPPEKRIERNNFDIGLLEQLSILDETEMLQEMAEQTISLNFTNFTDLYMFITSNYDSRYFKVLKNNKSFLESLTRGNYQKEQELKRKIKEGASA